MKLYTEEQIRKAIMIAENQKIPFTTIVTEHLTPIELPSDDEIHDECKIGGMDTNQQLCFQLGAKWMLNKIKGGDK